MNNLVCNTHFMLIFVVTVVLCLPAIHIVQGQTPDNNEDILLNTPQEHIHAPSLENQLDSLTTRRFSCALNKIPSAQYDSAYSTDPNASISQLTRMHFPAVLSAGNSLFVTDTFSLYQFDATERTKQAIKTPKYTSNNIIVGLTEQFIIQKHRIEQQSCITKAPLSDPSNESIIFCSKTYYKARYYNGAVYVLSNTPNNNKANHGITVSLERYTLDGNMSWRMTDMKDPSSSIVAAWNNTIITLSSDGILTAIDSNSGSTIYSKEYASELSLEKDFYQFNHFFVDKDNGLFIVASRYHNRLTVIDIPTGAIVKTHDFGLAFAHNKYLEEDFHYISLGEYAFPLNTIMGIDNGIIYIRKEKNVLAAIETKTGKELWKYNIYNSPFNDNDVLNYNDIAFHVGDILITDDLVIVGYNKYATALNKRTGNVVWNSSLFPFNGHFGYQMWLSCNHDQLIVQSDNIYLYPALQSIFNYFPPILIFLQNNLNL